VQIFIISKITVAFKSLNLDLYVLLSDLRTQGILLCYPKGKKPNTIPEIQKIQLFARSKMNGFNTICWLPWGCP